MTHLLPSLPRPVARATGQRQLHLLLALVSLLLVLLSVNRRSTLTLGHVLPHQAMRWVELNNLLLGLFTVVTHLVLLGHLRAVAAPAHRDRGRRAVGVLFVIGVYLYGVGYGDHEFANYLNGRFCTAGPSRWCDIVAFHDESFSHHVFFAGFLLLNLAVMVAQAAAPTRTALTRTDNVLLTVNALFVSGAVVANLAFERIGADLFVVAAVTVLAVVLLCRAPGQPMLRYYTVAYGMGLAATVTLMAL
ncbi:hypothetical protein [Streptomyces sp. YS415]|uniref:hypothetical protein n=1 Tax=Streptomyces sp. YS415 TaxID=2944806 RepID=UPI002021A375|nr:hypothetical protein [Streptomyces sp. YS415]MCL7429396.1 hypothetical protein [Streptomyces sp. YS415]